MYIIMFRSPKLQGKAKQYSRDYSKIALVRVDPIKLKKLGQTEPKMISPRSQGCLEVVDCAQLYYGKGMRSEGAIYLKQLKEKRDRLNSFLA